MVCACIMNGIEKNISYFFINELKWNVVERKEIFLNMLFMFIGTQSINWYIPINIEKKKNGYHAHILLTFVYLLSQ